MREEATGITPCGEQYPRLRASGPQLRPKGETGNPLSGGVASEGLKKAEKLLCGEVYLLRSWLTLKSHLNVTQGPKGKYLDTYWD